MTQEPFDVKRLSETEASDSISLLLYGPMGTGKTEFAASYGSRTAYLDVAESTATIHSLGFRKRYPSANPILLKFSEKGDKVIPDSPSAFNDVCDAIDYLIEKHKDEFDLFVVDDVTVLREFAMNKAMKIAKQYRGSAGFAVSQKEGLQLPEVGDYNAEMALMKKFCKGTIDICKEHRKHFILIAHERNIYGKPAKIGDQAPLLKVLPAFSGKTFPDDILGYFDLVWHTYTVNAGSNTSYRIDTVGSEMLRAKTRWGGIFNDVEKDLNFPTCVERIRKAAVESKMILAANSTT